MAFEWNEAVVSTMQEHWKSGLSASEIAKIIGAPSRNAVIGKIHRMQARGWEVPVRIQPTRQRKSRSTKRAKAPAPPTQPNGYPGARNCTLDDLGEHWGCRFVTDNSEWGQAKYCGRSGFPWCEHHHRLVYTPGSSWDAKKGRAR